jgi:hypothetical protein
MAAGGRCLAGGRHGARIEYLQKGKGRKSEVAFPPVPSRPVEKAKSGHEPKAWGYNTVALR